MGPISRWAVKRPFAALFVWLIMATTLIGAGISFRGEYNDSFELPDTDSSTAEELITAGTDSEGSFGDPTAKIIWRADNGNVTDPAAIESASEMLEELSKIDNVACVQNPVGEPFGSGCTDDEKAAAQQRAQRAELQAKAQAGDRQAAQQLQQAGAQDPMQAQFAEMSEDAQKAVSGLDVVGVSVDQKIAYGQVRFAKGGSDITAAQGDAVYDTVKEFNNTSNFTAGVSSRVLEQPHTGLPVSEIVGIIFALIVLIAAFGSIVAAFLPVVSAVISAVVGQFAILLIARGMDVATFAPMLAMMIGLGVGIDYALFVINRYQQAIAAGKDTKTAAYESVETAGRAVVFAAITVVIGIMGLLATGVTFFTGLALAASSTVLLMMIGATFVLPALMSKTGMGVFSLRIPWMRDTVFKSHDTGIFAKYGRWLERNYKWFGVVALIIIVAVASPAASMRQGFTDASGNTEGNTGRIAYDLTSEGFSEGINGPFVVAVDAKDSPGDNEGVQKIADALRDTDGVAATIAVPMEEDATTGIIQLLPTTGPSDEKTDELLQKLRDDVLPSATSGTDLKAYVGGATAISSDFTTVLQDALPLFLSIVVGLGFFMLMLLFRSILVPLVGALTSLLSLGASLGITTAVFQWGWARDLLQVETVGPIMPFIPIMVFAILFGLSMDYQVFLVSRMQEEWDRTGDNNYSIKEGMGSSGRVVAIAGAIMIAVFGAFIFGDDSTIKMFGMALAAAVLFDAFVVRLILVPSLMFLLKSANWWMPRALQKILPKLTIEPEVHDGPSAPALAGVGSGRPAGAAGLAGVAGVGAAAGVGGRVPGRGGSGSADAPQPVGAGMAAEPVVGDPQAFTAPPAEPEPEPVITTGPAPKSHAAAIVGIGALIVAIIALAGKS